jgi:hypothetical protein
MLAPDAARKVTVGTAAIPALASPAEPGAAYPLLNRESIMMMANRPEVTDRSCLISILSFLILICDQRTTHPDPFRPENVYKP